MRAGRQAATTALLALADGLDVAAACVGGTPKAGLGWTRANEDQRALAVGVLEGHTSPDPSIRAWIGFLDPRPGPTRLLSRRSWD
jgi:hypothetical protein